MMRRGRVLAAIALFTIAAILAPERAFSQQAPAPSAPATPASAPSRTPDVIYVPTPPDVVDTMLKLAKIGKDDVVYDLGCGDGRIVIAAAKQYGARGVGIDIDPQRIKEAEANANAAGVSDRVSFRLGDLFEADLSPATAVTLYLLTSLNLKLRPKLLSELKPGTPVVSHQFDMGDWKPDETVEIEGRRVYLWTVPAKAK
jgi:SAM-dependent methyltransferase